MKSSRGFTLLELMTVVALVGIVAAIAIPTMRALTRNASVGGISLELVVRLRELKTRALSDQRTYVAVLVDAPGNDGSACLFGTPGRCTRLYVLQDPTSLWTFGSFDYTSPGNNASLVELLDLGRGIRFATERAGAAAPAPFSAISIPTVAALPKCGGRYCAAVRFRPTGVVQVETSTGPSTNAAGLALALGTELGAAGVGRAEARGILIATPSGIVKGWSL